MSAPSQSKSSTSSSSSSSSILYPTQRTLLTSLRRMITTSTHELAEEEILLFAFHFLSHFQRYFRHYALASAPLSISPARFTEVWNKHIEKSVVSTFGSIVGREDESKKLTSCMHDILKLEMEVQLKKRSSSEKTRHDEITTIHDLLDLLPSQRVIEWMKAWILASDETMFHWFKNIRLQAAKLAWVTQLLTVLFTEWANLYRASPDKRFCTDASDFLTLAFNSPSPLFSYIHDSVHKAHLGRSLTSHPTRKEIAMAASEQFTRLKTAQAKLEPLIRQLELNHSGSGGGGAGSKSSVIGRCKAGDACLEGDLEVLFSSKYVVACCNNGCISVFHLECYRAVSDERGLMDCMKKVCKNGRTVRAVLKQSGKLLSSMIDDDGKGNADVVDVDEEQLVDSDEEEDANGEADAISYDFDPNEKALIETKDLKRLERQAEKQERAARDAEKQKKQEEAEARLLAQQQQAKPKDVSTTSTLTQPTLFEVVVPLVKQPGESSPIITQSKLTTKLTKNGLAAINLDIDPLPQPALVTTVRNSVWGEQSAAPLRSSVNGAKLLEPSLDDANQDSDVANWMSAIKVKKKKPARNAAAAAAAAEEEQLVRALSLSLLEAHQQKTTTKSTAETLFGNQTLPATSSTTEFPSLAAVSASSSVSSTPAPSPSASSSSSSSSSSLSSTSSSTSSACSKALPSPRVRAEGEVMDDDSSQVSDSTSYSASSSSSSSPSLSASSSAAAAAIPPASLTPRSGSPAMRPHVTATPTPMPEPAPFVPSVVSAPRPPVGMPNFAVRAQAVALPSAPKSSVIYTPVQQQIAPKVAQPPTVASNHYHSVPGGAAVISHSTLRTNTAPVLSVANPPPVMLSSHPSPSSAVPSVPIVAIAAPIAAATPVSVAAATVVPKLDVIDSITTSSTPTNVLLLTHLPSCMSIMTLGNVFCTFGRVQVKLYWCVTQELSAVITYQQFDSAVRAAQTMHNRIYELETQDGMSVKRWNVQVAFAQTPLHIQKPKEVAIRLVSQS